MMPGGGRSSPDGSGRDDEDRGAILVMTLIMCVILAIIATSLATYASAGLRTSRVTDLRNERLATVDAGLRIGMELVKQNPGTCLDHDVPFTGAARINGADFTVRCALVESSSAWSQYRVTVAVGLSGTDASGSADVQASTSSGSPCRPVAQVPTCQLTVNSWTVSG